MTELPADDWHPINVLLGIDARQIDSETFELRSPSHTVRVNKEGFNFYRTSDQMFEMYMFNNRIMSTPRTDK